MAKRLAALLCVLMFLPALALAELSWPENATQGQLLLQGYVSRVNDNLAQLGRGTVNSIFECYPGLAVMGVTAADGADSPEGVEMTFTLYEDRINILQLRVNQPELFAALAGSCIQACSPTVTTLEDAQKEPANCAAKAQTEPGNSFEDEVVELNGPAPRVYYAYYPNQYQDGVNWLQMTLVFPQDQSGDVAVVTVTENPPMTSTLYYTDENGEVVGYEGVPYDGGIHLEVFITPTPEPDSAAGDAMNR